MTVTELADSQYPGITYDTALPQDWVNLMVKRGFDPRGQFVWGYPGQSVFGQPLPLTKEAAMFCAAMTISLVG